eukprot:TRINITY_DN26171_c0_g1_i1.p1 TRINITY_DN26171_c0_g1~~TRINITY_DN26171_c0_g1_i1.p1  ORF type:complete len:400 (+),score=84.43 TRINITY_DN26171_c0_g1_i1:52-1251(+)
MAPRTRALELRGGRETLAAARRRREADGQVQPRWLCGRPAEGAQSRRMRFQRRRVRPVLAAAVAAAGLLALLLPTAAAGEVASSALPCTDAICVAQAQERSTAMCDIGPCASCPPCVGAATSTTTDAAAPVLAPTTPAAPASQAAAIAAIGDSPLGAAAAVPPASAVAQNVAGSAAAPLPPYAASRGVDGSPLLSCTAPRVDNSEGISCDQGLIIASGGSCTADCADGYYPSDADLTCVNGTLFPATFTCVNYWYDSWMATFLGTLLAMCCLCVVAAQILQPMILQHRRHSRAANAAAKDTAGFAAPGHSYVAVAPGAYAGASGSRDSAAASASGKPAAGGAGALHAAPGGEMASFAKSLLHQGSEGFNYAAAQASHYASSGATAAQHQYEAMRQRSQV